MVKVPNLRIEISEDARRALNFEVALTGESLSVCASKAVLNGVSAEAVKLSQNILQPMDVTTPMPKVDKAVQSIPVANHNVPISQDPRAMRYIRDQMNECSGVQIAKALNRSVSSVNKYIKSIRDQS